MDKGTISHKKSYRYQKNLTWCKGTYNYSLFTLSWPLFESGSLRNGGMLILCIYFAVDGMPIEMYRESWIAGLLTSDNIMLYMAGFETTRGI